MVRFLLKNGYESPSWIIFSNVASCLVCKFNIQASVLMKLLLNPMDSSESLECLKKQNKMVNEPELEYNCVYKLVFLGKLSFTILCVLAVCYFRFLIYGSCCELWIDILHKFSGFSYFYTSKECFSLTFFFHRIWTCGRLSSYNVCKKGILILLIPPFGSLITAIPFYH